jgi:23S rRNA (uracil1939-C5)-methyltransferase
MSGDGEWLHIESLDLDAQGVAHDASGKVVFVDGALPGETVRARIHRRKASWEQGTLAELQRASAQRTTPRCAHFGLHRGACGGCKMQHFDVAAQIAVKQRALEDALWHLGKVRPEMLLRPIEGPAWGYRHRARLSVRHVAKKGGVLVGFHERRSSYVADIAACDVLPPALSALLLPLRELIGGMDARDRLPQIEVAVGDTVTALVLRHLEPLSPPDLTRLREFGARHAVQWWLQPKGPESARPLDDGVPGELAYTLSEFGLTLPFRPTDFTQVNPFVNAVLVSRAVRLLDVQRSDRVVDWFCGLGNFSLPIATRAASVLGVEGAETLLARARAAAMRNGLGERIRFASSDLFELGTTELIDFGAAQRWLVDPPREGALALMKALAEVVQRPALAAAWTPPARIVYVSCNPATLARDAGLLMHQAGYRCTGAGAVNMFPHTAHVESMAVFDRSG